MSHIATVSATALAFDQTMNGAYSLLDPINDIFYYLVPKLGTFFTGSTRISKKNGGSHKLIAAQEVRVKIREEFSALSKAAGMTRKIKPYFATTFSSYGGKCSLSSPVVQIPTWHLIRSEETLPNKEKLDLKYFGAEAELGEREKQVLRNDHWRFTDHETRFFILRSLVQIGMNDSMFKIIARVAMVAAIVLLKISPLSWPISLAILLAAVLMYFAVDRNTQGHLDAAALKCLMTLSPSKLVAIETALNALKKIRDQNLELKGQRWFSNWIIDREGNERFNFAAPALSKRIRALEELRLQSLRKGEEPEALPEPLTEARVELLLGMGAAIPPL